MTFTDTQLMKGVAPDGTATLTARNTAFHELFFRTMKPCEFSEGEDGTFDYFIRPVRENGKMERLRVTPELYKEMSGGSPMVVLRKDYSNLHTHYFRVLIPGAAPRRGLSSSTAVVTLCDVVAFSPVFNRMKRVEQLDVTQITVVDRPTGRWVTRYPQYIKDQIPYGQDHSFELLRTLDKQEVLEVGAQYGKFVYDGPSYEKNNVGLLFTPVY